MHVHSRLIPLRHIRHLREHGGNQHGRTTAFAVQSRTTAARCRPTRAGPRAGLAAAAIQEPQHGQQQYRQPQHQQVRPYEPQQPVGVADGQHRTGLTGAQQFWYVLQCIAFGAGYFAKIPAKKALADFGMAELTSAEKFWYVLECIAFGAGYFAKLSTAKALSEMPQLHAGG